MGASLSCDEVSAASPSVAVQLRRMGLLLETGAMSRDKASGPVRRPRLLKRAEVAAGPLKDLKDLLYEAYLAAEAPTLDDVAADIAGADADDQALTAAPSRDSVHRCISSAELPAKQADAVAVAVVLARRAAWDEEDLSRRIRSLWIQAQTARPAGLPIREITDPFALEVHRAIEVSSHSGADLPLLPTYVQRTHDLRIHQRVSEALRGRSQLVVLVGDSSSGKTRACWEAVQKLPDEWRLWHPIDPSRVDALLNDLASVGPRTVVWLNEVQHYLLTPPGDLGERAAAGLRSLMRDPTRAPILVLATTWPEHWSTLVSVPEQSHMEDPHSQARALLTGGDVHVSSRFTGRDLVTLSEAASVDERIKHAMQNAEQGQITQYLAGAPALLERYRNAPVAARAVIAAAMDIRRLGHGPAIPHSLLENSAGNYLTDQQWDQLPDNWLEGALFYATQSLRGARGPLSRIRPRSGEVRLNEPHYRLADYLEQYGSEARQDSDVPSGLWYSLLSWAERGSFVPLALAAMDRRLFHVSARFCRQAAIGGEHGALVLVARLLWDCGRRGEATTWYRAAVTAGVEGAVTEAANRLWAAGSPQLALSWLEGVCKGNPAALAYAGDLLWRDGRVGEAIEWYRRAADAGDDFAQSFLDHAAIEPSRTDESLALLERRAEEGDVNALYQAAKLAEEAGRIPEMISYYMRAVRAGDVTAMEFLFRLGFPDEGEESCEWVMRHAYLGVDELMGLEKMRWPVMTRVADAVRSMDPGSQSARHSRRCDNGLEPDGRLAGHWEVSLPGAG